MHETHSLRARDRRLDRGAGLPPDKPVVELDRRVAAVAEGFVRGRAAAAECHTVSLFVRCAIRRLYGDAAAHPQRAAASERRIFDYTDRRRKRFLDFFVGFLVVDD
jgi:hypothetical protein